MATPSGTVTFRFTDIDGSTRQCEPARDAISPALQRHDLIMRDVIERHHGHVLERVGDAFCAVFTLAPNALR